MQAFNNNLTGKKPEISSLITGTLAIVDSLVQLLVDEVELVKARKTVEHAELLKQKQRLTLDYRANMKSIAAQPELFKQASDETRAIIRNAAQRLADATDTNAKMLRSAITATQRLIQNIMSVVKKEKLTQPGYVNPNTLHLALGTYSPTCKPVSVSRTV